MLTVTDKAAQYLREGLKRKQEGAPEALRIVHTEDGYQLTLDNAKDGDQIFEYEGENYLLVDTEVGEALSDASLDLQESARGATLTLTASRTPETAGETSDSGEKSESKPEPELEPKSKSVPEP